MRRRVTYRIGEIPQLRLNSVRNATVLVLSAAADSVHIARGYRHIHKTEIPCNAYTAVCHGYLHSSDFCPPRTLHYNMNTAAPSDLFLLFSYLILYHMLNFVKYFCGPDFFYILSIIQAQMRPYKADNKRLFRQSVFRGCRAR